MNPTPRPPQPDEDVEIVWGREQYEHIELRHGVTRADFALGWHDADRVDFDLIDLADLVKLSSHSSGHPRGMLELIWVYKKNARHVIIPDTAFFPDARGAEGGALASKERGRRRERREGGKREKRPKSREQGGRRRGSEEEA